ncbi:MAG: septal ring lytic transglycosylase RlpA family protein [Spirochaetes bacterium]|nr:MAG: septal ring lytic transglycosylase RlpA family protein [Spirochaetota bacterium]
MKHVVRAVIIIIAILLMFMLLTACAPGKSLTKDSSTAIKKKEAPVNGDEYVYTYPDEPENEMVDPRAKHAGKKTEAKGQTDEIMVSGTADTPRKEQFYQTGMASWYGREFNGKMTASGEKFDMNGLTAAHKTLPFGSLITVKNLDTGKSVQVKVNDRGPYKKDRILDLSFGAAKQLDMVSTGEVMVGINLVKQEGDQKTAVREGDEVEPVSGDLKSDGADKGGRNGTKNDSEGRYSIQAGAFYSQKKAQDLKVKIESMVDRPVILIKEKEYFKVRIEGIHSKSDATAFKKKLSGSDISSYIIENKE